jgi:hypothetical protein
VPGAGIDGMYRSHARRDPTVTFAWGLRARAVTGPAWSLALSLGVLLAVLLTACAGTQAVVSGSQHLYVSLPASWKVYSESQLAQTQAFQALGVSAPPPFLAGASGSPRPHAADVFTQSSYPWAVVLAEPLTADQRSSMSLLGLNDILVPVDQLSSEGIPVQTLSQPELLVNGAMRGTLESLEIGLPSPIGEVDYDQETWSNSATNKVWLLMVGCSPRCFQAQHSAITHIVSSFYVPDRGNQ